MKKQLAFRALRFLLFGTIFITLSNFATAANLTISDFVPQGEVKNVQQIRIRFSQPVVRMGNPRGEAPIESPCLQDAKHPGDGRWLDSNSWVFDFKKSLPSGMKCNFKVKSSLQSLEGHAVKGTTNYTFSTGSPQIQFIAPSQYTAIDDEQNFIFVFDGPIQKDELLKKFSFTIEGLGDILPISLVEGKAALEIYKNAKSTWQAVAESDEDYYEVRHRQKALEKGSENFIVVKINRKLPFKKKLDISFEGQTSQRFNFNVREQFKADFSCERENIQKPCIPISPMTLMFNEYVDFSYLSQIYLVDSKGSKILPKFDGKSKKPEMSVQFSPPFAEDMQYTLFLPANLKGDSGLALSNAQSFPLKIATSSLPPLLKFSAGFGIIEAGPDAALPVTMRELEPEIKSILQKTTPNLKGAEVKLGGQDIVQILELMNSLSGYTSKAAMRESIFSNLTDAQEKKKTFRLSKPIFPMSEISIPKPNGPKAFEVIGIPLKEPGFYVVEMVSPKLGSSLIDTGEPYHVRTSALVTNLGVNLKFSAHNALVWVTDLKTAASVADAEIELFDCKGTSFAKGKTDRDGLAKILSEKDLHSIDCGYKSAMYSGFVAVARKGNDFSLTRSDWNRGIEPYRFQVPVHGEAKRIHSVIARNLLRPGETLHAKHFVRMTSLQGLDKPKAESLPKEVIIAHATQEAEYKIPVKWDLNTMTAETIWTLPKGMKLGTYHIKLGKNYNDVSGSFDVENFRIPVLKGQIQFPSKNSVKPSVMPVQLGLEFLGGGPASNYDVKLKWNSAAYGGLSTPEEYQNFSMVSGGLKEGLFRTGDEEDSEGGDRGSDADLSTKVASVNGEKAIKLNSTGASTFEINHLKNSAGLQTLNVEMTYKDPNGEYQSIGRNLTIYPSEYLVGIRSKTWATTSDKVSFEALVLDTKSKPVSDAPVEIDFYTSDYVTHRKRLLGGFYAYEEFREVKKLGSLCKGRTNSRGLLSCDSKVNFSGEVYAVAKTSDKAGNPSYANASQWIFKDNMDYWMGGNDGDRIDLIPSKKRYEPGETAKFEFKSPFKTGRILLTVEREDVIEQKFIDIKNAGTNFLEVAVKENWAPNVFISAIAVRGRVEDYKPTALIDLGKPAFKMGLTSVNVGWQKHELKVRVDLDKAVYNVRAKAKAKIHVTNAQGTPVQGEVAIAVVDEGLLELKQNNTWNLLEVMMAPHSLNVSTSTSYGEIVGKRHFGIKAVAHGGDGGGAASSKVRELFETLLIWKGQLKLDKNGDGNIEIPVNDSLTSFRVVAVASHGVDQFGSGFKSFQTTQDFMIFSGLPTVVRNGDKFSAEYTIRNASTKDQSVAAGLTVTANDPNVKFNFPVKQLSMKPQTSEKIIWQIEVPEGVEQLQTLMALKNQAGTNLDQIKKPIEVKAVVPVRVQQMTMLQLDKPKVDMYIDRVPNAVPKSTSLQIDLSKSLLGTDAGQFDFWKYYPYSCLEQKTSRAISLNNKADWEKISNGLDSYIDSDGLLKYFPEAEQGSEILTAYILSITYQADWELSDRHLDILTKGLQNVIAGKTRRHGLTFADDEYRKLILLEALSKHRRMNIADLSAIHPAPQLWPTAQVVTWYQILLLEKSVAKRDVLLAEAEQVLKSRIYMSGAKAMLRDQESNYFWWLMIDPDTAMARLFLSGMKSATWKDDVPRLIRGFVETQKNGSWHSTTSNAWGTLALREYASLFEKTPVSGETKVSLGSISKSLQWTEKKLSQEFSAIEKKETLSFEHKGAGKPWAFVTMKAASPRLSAVSSGFSIEKTIEGVEQKAKPAWTQGDIMRIKMKVTSQTDNGWVVIYDPIPSGATILGGNPRQNVLLEQSRSSNDLWAISEERTYDSYRSYYYWFPKGTFEVSYLIRLNQSGEFPLPSTRVEAMYNSDLYGETPNSKLTIKE